MRRLLIALLLFLAAADALALTAPSSFSSGRSGLAVEALGATCFTFDVGADNLPCNPAFMAMQQDQAFSLSLFGGNNISHFNDAVALAQGRGQQSNVENLFGSPNNSSLEAGLEGAYLNHNFGIAYEPFRVNYLSAFRDPALPQVTVFAAVEQSARIQLASLSAEDIYVGLQARYLDRQVVASRFFVTDLLAENGTSLLQPQESQYYFLEPGFLYAPKSDFWNPKVSFNLVNWGLHSNNNSLLTDPVPEAHLGFAVSPTVGLGQWGWAVDVGWNQNIVNTLDAFTLGTYYQMGILKIFGSLNTLSSGLGFTTMYDRFKLGLSYTSTVDTLSTDESVIDQRVYFLLGCEI